MADVDRTILVLQVSGADEASNSWHHIRAVPSRVLIKVMKRQINHIQFCKDLCIYNYVLIKIHLFKETAVSIDSATSLPDY